MLKMGDFDGRAAQFFPGAGNENFQRVVIFGRQHLDGFVPVGGFDVAAQIREGDEIVFIQREGVLQALADSRGKGVWLTADAGTRPHLDETEGARHFQLFAQGGDRNAQFLA